MFFFLQRMVSWQFFELVELLSFQFQFFFKYLENKYCLPIALSEKHFFLSNSAGNVNSILYANCQIKKIIQKKFGSVFLRKFYSRSVVEPWLTRVLVFCYKRVFSAPVLATLFFAKCICEKLQHDGLVSSLVEGRLVTWGGLFPLIFDGTCPLFRTLSVKVSREWNFILIRERKRMKVVLSVFVRGER